MNFSVFLDLANKVKCFYRISFQQNDSQQEKKITLITA